MRSRRRLRGVAGLVLSASLVLVGCVAGGGEDAGGSDSAPAAKEFPRTVSHAMGQTQIPAEPTRIAALDQTFVDAAFALDTPIVGFTQLEAGNPELPEYLGQDRQTLGGTAQSVGTLDQPNLEKIAVLQPDLIASAKVRHEEIYNQLSAIAPTVFSETTGPTWKDNIRLLARAIGKEDLAEQRISAYEQRAQRIGDAIRAKEGRNPTISVIRFLPEETRLYQRKSFSGVVLEDTGLARPPSQAVDAFAVEISAERILDANADHIFLTVSEGGDAAQTRDRFVANPLWGQLTGEIHEVSDEVWGTAVGLQGAQAMLDDLAATFQVDPARTP